MHVIIAIISYQNISGFCFLGET